MLEKQLFQTAAYRRRTIRYFLLTAALPDGMKHYGVAVEYCGETVLVRDITVSYRNISVLLKMLVKGRVTPTTVEDIVADWLLG